MIHHSFIFAFGWLLICAAAFLMCFAFAKAFGNSTTGTENEDLLVKEVEAEAESETTPEALAAEEVVEDEAQDEQDELQDKEVDKWRIYDTPAYLRLGRSIAW